jgi:hypothetical protein
LKDETSIVTIVTPQKAANGLGLFGDGRVTVLLHAT